MLTPTITMTSRRCLFGRHYRTINRVRGRREGGAACLGVGSSRREFVGGNNKEKPFRILGLQQIAVGSTDQEGLRLLWKDILGLPQVGTFRSASENVDEDILILGDDDNGEPVEVDLMTPLDPNKRPKVRVGYV